MNDKNSYFILLPYNWSPSLEASRSRSICQISFVKRHRHYRQPSFNQQCRDAIPEFYESELFSHLISPNDSSVDLFRTCLITTSWPRRNRCSRTGWLTERWSIRVRLIFPHICCISPLGKAAKQQQNCPCLSRTSEQLHFREAVPGVMVLVEEAVESLVQETLTTIENGLANWLSSDLETLVLCPVQKVVNFPSSKLHFQTQSLIDPDLLLRWRHYSIREKEILWKSHDWE